MIWMRKSRLNKKSENVQEQKTKQNTHDAKKKDTQWTTGVLMAVF